MAVSEATLRDVRLRYKAAYSASQNCVRLRSVAPCPELLHLEAKALRELTEARAKMLAAIAGLHNTHLAKHPSE
jgi:hypothetical protein